MIYTWWHVDQVFGQADSISVTFRVMILEDKVGRQAPNATRRNKLPSEIPWLTADQNYQLFGK
jgi:hypothetical protein